MVRFTRSLPNLISCALLCLVILLAAAPASAVEIARLCPENWDEFAPQGKEVDCIYGDYVIRNDHLIAVIAQPVKGRNANMTVRGVGGMIIDLTERAKPNDQLSCFYAGAAFVDFVSLDDVAIHVDGQPVNPKELVTVRGAEISFTCQSAIVVGKPRAKNRYTLRNPDRFLACRTEFVNPHAAAISFELMDSVRADKFFTFGVDSNARLFWANDEWFGQSYGILAAGREVKYEANARNNQIKYEQENSSKVTLARDETVVLERRLVAAAHLLGLKSVVQAVTNAPSRAVTVTVQDAAGPVGRALLTVRQGKTTVGMARTGKDGTVAFTLADGDYDLEVAAQGRPEVKSSIRVAGQQTAGQQIVPVKLEPCGYVAAEISDQQGGPIPCKVAFKGKNGTPSPNFGPDGGDGGVLELVYSHNGRFRQEIGPGEYDVIVSYGPEYDAVFTTLQVKAGESSALKATLKRVVDTRGWVSSDFHNHSTPSGDNASSQLGRVQNLLCEHIEFAPCTEHNRIDTYVPHLKRLGVEALMATCSGMELTGSPLPLNHQNAFPLAYSPRTQDGGGPVTDENPVVQIERLALWDQGSDKLVQQNHPDLVALIGDKDSDGKADGGFHKVFGFMDVVEVHPPQGVFAKPEHDAKGKLTRNPIFHWMQMLNLGYRIPGVVNTDAHYTFHDSGWLRNYLRSSTDDPAKVDTMEMVHMAERGRLTMTTGPFLEVELSPSGPSADGSRKSVGPGEDIALADGKAKLRVKIQCANWMDINRVQVFLNGRPHSQHNFTRRTTPERFADGVVKFEQTLELELTADTHVIVATIGEGLELGQVFGPSKGKTPPVAVSNPIFVDVDGNGFLANGDLLDVPLPLDQTELPKHRR